MQITDQLGQSLEFDSSVERIISVVPSITELLHHLELDKETIGITKFCIHPNDWFKKKKRVGGTKTLNIDLISELQPDLIIANKEENEEAQIRELKNSLNVYVSDISNLQQALNMINAIGQITKRSSLSNLLCKNIVSGFEHISTANLKVSRVAYLIWKEPMMVAAGDTFINDMLARIGYENVYQTKTRYPVSSIEELQDLEPDYIFLSSEPYPFRKSDAAHYSNSLLQSKVILVDGTYFSWYGSRLINAASYLSALKMEFP